MSRRAKATALALIFLLMVIAVVGFLLLGGGGKDKTVAADARASSSTGTVPAASATRVTETPVPASATAPPAPSATSTAVPAQPSPVPTDVPPTDTPVPASATPEPPAATPTTTPPTTTPTPLPPVVSEASAAFNVVAGGSDGISIPCPPGTVRASGGFTAPALAASSIYVSAPGSDWNVYLANGTPSTVGVQAFAVCVANIRATSVSASSATNFGPMTSHRPCDGGRGLPRRFGRRGRRLPRQPHRTTVIAYVNRPSANGWQVSVFNHGAPTSNFTAYAVCLPEATSTIVSEATIVPGTVGPVSNASVTATCPADRYAIGGGYAYADSFDPLTKAWLSRLDGNGWKATARNSTASSQPLTVYAVCMRPS